MTDKWKYNGVEFGVGDRVKVVRLPDPLQDTKNGMGEGLDWKNFWVDDMDGILTLCAHGVTFEIYDIGVHGVEFAPVVGLENFFLVEYLYPLCSLEKA